MAFLNHFLLDLSAALSKTLTINARLQIESVSQCPLLSVSDYLIRVI